MPKASRRGHASTQAGTGVEADEVVFLLSRVLALMRVFVSTDEDKGNCRSAASAYLRRMELPAAFQQQMRTLLGQEFGAFAASMTQPPPVSIRRHPLKSRDLPPCTDPTPWCPGGCYLQERPVFTLDPLLHAGAYYVQDASSMALTWVLNQLPDLPDPRAALDLCAAPGGKSLILHDWLDDKDLLISNEVHPGRYATLLENLTRHGTIRTTTSNWTSGAWARHSPGAFDLILADVPCSGEGMFRRKPVSLPQWSPQLIADCVRMQREILTDAMALLREGGCLLYATCTFNRQENEEQVRWMEAEFPMKCLPLHPPSAWGIEIGEAGIRFFPHRGRFEGMFFSILQKTGPTTSSGESVHPTALAQIKTFRPENSELKDWVQDTDDFTCYQWEDGLITALSKTLHVHGSILSSPYLLKRSGLAVATLQKGGRLAPHHALALSASLSSAVPTLDLDRDDALRFLRKETLANPGDQRGYRVVRYEGLPMGWVKAIPGRLNNLLPTNYRIRM